MGLAKKLLGAAKPLWFLLVMGATVAAYGGYAEPLVSPSEIPEGPLFMFGAPAAVLLVGLVTITILEGTVQKGAWRKAGRAAGLTPEEGSGSLGRASLTGTVDGRPVRARSETETTVRSGEDASTTRTFTIVEADLDGPTTDGLAVAPAEGEVSSGGTTVRVARMLEATSGEISVVEADELTVAGTGEALVGSVRSSPGWTALANVEDLKMAYAGDAREMLSGALDSAAEDDGGASGWLQTTMADRAREALLERAPEGSSTVSLVALGLAEDGDRLRRKSQAVAALADAVDEAGDSSG